MSRSGPLCLVDGEALDVVPADDRGLLFGDHLFETMAFHNGRAPLWEDHWARLRNGCRALGLVCPDPEQVAEECRRVSPTESSCVIRLTLTRGSGGQAYFPLAEPRCRRIVQVRPWPESIDRQRQVGLETMLSPVQLACTPLLGGLKHGNRLEQVMAARACAQAGVEEALLFDLDGRLVEGLMSNLILESESGLITPATESGVRGVGLGWLMNRPEVEIATRPLDRAAVGTARSILMVNSVAGVRPVVQLDQRSFPITPLCRHLQQLWAEHLS